MGEGEEYEKRHRNRIWLLLTIGWFLLSALLLILFPSAGGLIALVLLITILVGRGLLFRNSKYNP